MKAYRAILSAAFRMHLQYRAAALAGFGTQLFWGLIRVMIFGAFYRSSASPQPMSYPQTVTYLWLTQAMLLLLAMGPNPEIRAMIRSGTVAYELLRPLDLYALWYSRSLSSRAAAILLRAIPMFIVAGLFLGLQLPPSVASAGACALATMSALLLSCAMSTLISISLLWTISGEGMGRLVLAASYLLSGVLVPLPLYPDWAQSVLAVLPFRGLMDIPFRLYAGHIPAGQILPLLGHQLGWTLALVVFGRWLVGRATQRIVIQGG